MDDREIYFATALANPRVRAAVRGHLKDIEWSSRVAQRIVEYFCLLADAQPYDKITLHGHLIHEFMESEIVQILNKCLEHVRTFTEDTHGYQTTKILQDFQKFYNRRMATKLIRECQHDPEKLVEAVENLQRMKFATLPLDILGDLDVDRVVEEDLGNIRYIPSSFPCVRTSCGWGWLDDQQAGGYSTGQLVQVCAPPGVGKSLFLAHEVVGMMRANKDLDEKDKFKVYWLALGDMNKLDFIQRFTAIYRGRPINEIKRNTKLYFDDEVREAFKSVKISVVPPGHIDIHGVRYFIENSVADPTFDPQIIVIDYDANLLMNRDTMYLASEEIYNIAAAIAKPVARPGRLVFIASQPKIDFWNVCPMPKEAAAESSRKQAIIDMMITIARDPNCIEGTVVGKILVAKNRRGIEGCIGLYLLDGGIFFNIADNIEYASSLESSSSRLNSGNQGGRSKRSMVPGW
jgi:hypothetical protein